MAPRALPSDVEALWREVLNNGHRHAAAFLPGGPRCTVCFIPMGGVSKPITQGILHRKPSRKNPSFCNY